MEIIRHDENTVAIRQIDSFLAELLRRIPDETDPEDDAVARERLFSRPVESRNDKFNEEWKAYVEPELEHLFESSKETVGKDLQKLKESGKGENIYYTLFIPVTHLEQWLNALNQARLVLAARNKFTDQELAADFNPIVNSKRDMNLLQIHIYGFLQEIFLQHLP